MWRKQSQQNIWISEGRSIFVWKRQNLCFDLIPIIVNKQKTQLLKKYLCCEVKKNKRPFSKRNYPMRAFFGDQKHCICGQRELQNSGINIGVGKEKAAVCVFSYGKQALLKKKNHNRTCFFAPV